MVRFDIIGMGFLDIEPDGIGFKKDNQQFRFSDITFGRSVEFDVPATDRNKRLLGYGDDPAMDGMMLRTRNECQMVYDGGAIMGRLEVKSFKGDAFSCVFYFGAGSFPSDVPLSNVPIGDTHIVWSNSMPVYPANAIPTSAPPLAFVAYERPASILPLLPTMELRQLVVMVATSLGLDFEVDIPSRYRVVFDTLNGASEETVRLAMAAIDAATVSQTTLFRVVDIDLESATAVIFGAYVGGTTTPSKGFGVLADIDVTFDYSTPSNVFLIRWSSRLGGYEALNLDPQTGRCLNLSGRTISLKKNEIYFLATKPPLYVLPHYGYESGDIPFPYDIGLTAVRTSTLSLNEDWYLRNNVPEMTVFELFRSAALATGRELLIEEDGKVCVKRNAYGNDFLAVERVISIDEVGRNVEAWGGEARIAVLRFDSDQTVTHRIEAAYEVDNANLEGEEEYVCRFSEGEQGNKGIFIEDVEGTASQHSVVLKKPTIAYVDDESTTLQRVPIPLIDGYEDVAINSTSVRIRLLAGEAEFFALKPQTTFVWRGMAYVWTSAEWSDGIMSLTLQKVSQKR